MLLLPGLLYAGAAAQALEFGAPLFREDIDDRVTFEVLYERMDRDIRQQTAFSAGRFRGRQREDRTRLHVVFHPRPDLSIRLDGGVTSSEASENPVPLGGALLKYRLLSWRGARLAVAAGAAYVEGIEYRRRGLLTLAGEVPAVRRTESYAEAGGALLVSRPVRVTAGLTLHPYAGAAATWLDADGAEQFTLETSGRRRTDPSVDFREDSPVTLVAGVAAVARRNFGVRVEAAFLDTAGYSAGVFFSF